MTALTSTAPVAERRLRRPRGLAGAMLRLHRSALWFWLMLVALAAGVLLWAAGPGLDAAWAEYRAMGCDRPSPDLGCDYTGPAYGRYDTAVALGAGSLSVLPFLTAAWAGAALIGRELELGTAQLAWTQSVSPARWLAAKLAVPALLLVPGTLLLTVLHRALWSSDGPLRVAMSSRAWWGTPTFAANGTLATAYALLGLAVGALAGVLLRRALPASATAVAALAALLYALDALRPRLWPTVTVTARDDLPEPDGIIVESGTLTSSGARVPLPGCTGEASCGDGIAGFYARHHPASHFWPLQLMETAVVLTVVALAALTAFRLLRHRTGAAV
ncbi:ABC transporter permease [Streptomyces sp. NPDC052682]|uniref:ABC transporter permease n=1 Tax=Streptomyces sp. NPDC052682 TaxID=3154954 RepID=UPI003424A484